MMRIAHAPYLIAGHVSSLSLAEQGLGFQSRTYSLIPDKYGFPADVTIAANAKLGELARPILLKRLIAESDVIHFNFGSSCLPQRSKTFAKSGLVNFAKNIYLSGIGRLELQDVKLLSSLGKKIIVTFQGDDARQISSHNNKLAFEEASYYSDKSNFQKARRIKIWEDYADHIYVLNPDLTNYFSRDVEFLPYSTMPMINVASQDLGPTSAKSGKFIKFAHAPSHYGIKGTRFIKEAIENLQSKGLQVELVVISGKSNAQTQQIISECDYLIDQLILGWYGGVAVEAMKLGKPVLSFVDRQSKYVIGEEMFSEIPIINATTQTIESVLQEVIINHSIDYTKLSQHSISYAEKWHSSEKIAATTTSQYKK